LVLVKASESKNSQCSGGKGRKFKLISYQRKIEHEKFLLRLRRDSLGKKISMKIFEVSRRNFFARKFSRQRRKAP